jgi:1-acyl-sn-glycerol-3-phosphate acyltransferase
MTGALATNPLPVRCYRWMRTCVHLLAGVMTTMLIFPFVAPQRRRALIKRWSVRLLRILAVRLEVTGDPGVRGGNVLLVANHISWLDIFVLDAVHPVRFVGKSELTRWPVIAQMIRGAGTIFIERERRHDTRRVNHEMARLLAHGDVVAIFPEGMTSDGTSVLPFKSSLLQPIVEAGGHVQPVAIRYWNADGSLAMAPNYVGDTSFATSFWAVCGARRLTVRLVAFPPIAAHGRSRRDLGREAEAAIRTAWPECGAGTAPGTRAGPAT